MTTSLVIDLDDPRSLETAAVGGKGAGLARLRRTEGVAVPDGFVVTTDAFVAVTAPDGALFDRLDDLDPAVAGRASADLRAALEGIALPDDLRGAIDAALGRLASDTRVAVRSSATAEDLASASFAGQHDSFLDVGATADEVADHVRRCWASLFTDRAVAYRRREGIDHRSVRMAVVVQEMVAADASGVLFTADPLTSNRRVAAVEAVAGLGDRLVSGVAEATTWRVREGEVVERHAPEGSTASVLDDRRVVALVALGRRVEQALGAPQDLEWCVEGDQTWVVQSRPITTLFPIPEVHDHRPHVYVSVGHQQMMTDPMTPLGLSVWQRTAARPMHEAAGRPFIDVADALASPAARTGLIAMFQRSDPLIGGAMQAIVDRGDLPAPPDGTPAPPAGPPLGAAPPPVEEGPALVAELIAATEASLAELEARLDGATGTELLDRIAEDLASLATRLFDPRSHRAIMASIEAIWWLGDHLGDWLGEPGAADALARSVPGDVTSEMGLALIDVADALRPHPAVVALLDELDELDELDGAGAGAGGSDDDLLQRLDEVPGGAEARRALDGWLARYGMRGPGEIDLGRPRWAERPTALVPLLRSHVHHLTPGEARRRFEAGEREAQQAAAAALDRVRALPDGEAKARALDHRIALVRTFLGYREFPKYGLIRRYGLYRRALLAEAERLVASGALASADDLWFLRLEELHEVVASGRSDASAIARRRADLAAFARLSPPRVMTGDGEVVRAAYAREGLPEGALVGLGVSAGTVEGRARVVLDPSRARLAPGDVLVTPHTDPSWSPLFTIAGALVTEVGGLTTHGAVVAREYGLPAVVGVEDATRHIVDGQLVRVHGAAGFVELLGPA
ncbi:MAG: phosphoenolpyruvate synthase [Acidimicrobiales bacterium]|nr:phosphoenolpyruvate synthase [Acidimicrobiales bacterium]HRW36149.1 phosphoenolpyruvate synthase [Aquihabitans sp.]